jgi:hypothetical protein
LGDQPPKDKKSTTSSTKSPSSTTKAVVSTVKDDTEDEDLDDELFDGTPDEDVLTADDTLEDEPKELVLIKESGVAPSKPTVEQTDAKKVNAKTVLMQFFSDAKIVDNGDGTVSYTLTTEQHKQFQHDCMNVR